MTSALAGLPLAVEETREVFEGIGTLGEGIFYALAFTSTSVFAWGCWRRIRKYRRGRPAGRFRSRESRVAAPSNGERVTATPNGEQATAVVQGAPTRNGSANGHTVDAGTAAHSLVALAANTTVRKRDRAAGIAHFLVFWGFITLFIGTVILTIDYDIVRNATNALGEERSFFKGAFYLGYSVILDTMGLAFVLGMLYLMWRRAFGHKAALDYTRAEKPEGGYSRDEFVQGDWLFLGLLFALLSTGFLLEGFRIRASGFPSFEVWSPVGWLIARGVRAVGIGTGGAGDVRIAMWWVHAVMAMGFVAYIPFSKAMHMLTDTANVVAFDPASARRLHAPRPGADHIGYRTLDDFTWKELLDLDSCTKCGRCHVACPATASGAPLSPRDFILDLRQWADESTGGRTFLDRERRPTTTGPLAGNGDVRVAGDVITVETLWSCTTCMACVEACPVGIEHVSTIVELRRSLVDEGAMEPTLQSALQNLAQQGNSFGKSSRMRARWTKELDFEVPDARTTPVRYLWFVGDFAAFDERLQELSRTLARILHDAGVDFGLLYEDEWNSGNDVRRVGEEGLFEMLVEHNVAAFESASFDEIFTTDPHSLNTLRNEYPEFGLDKPTRHYTEVLADLLESGAIPTRSLDVRVTYHDPCYLARYNGVTDPPRRVLRALGCDLVEMPRNKDNTFCCGAGGGRIWMDDSGLEERPSENRIREAAELDVERFVVACPKDFTMYTDAAKTTGHDDRLQVVDVIQLVDEARVAADLVVTE
jgi:Fe-S oxidoreductase/nitrate reductase gamma subunit